MSAQWTTRYQKRTLPTMKNVLFIEGLPGVGSVGKLAIDFMIEHVGAKKIATFSSQSFPPSVFVNESDLVELPAIELYHKKINKKDVLFLGGDLQPVTELSCYSFAEKIVQELTTMNVGTIITTAGIGLQTEPKEPLVYCAGNNKEQLKLFKRGTIMQEKLHGKIGPIVGISGILLCIAGKYNIPSFCVLAETFAHPMYLGIPGARKIIEVLNKKFSFLLNIKMFDKEVSALQRETTAEGEGKKTMAGARGKVVNYIG